MLHTMAATDPQRRALAAATGGRARVATAGPGAMTAARRAGGIKTNAAPTLARRIAAAWADLTPAERAEIRETLAALLTAGSEKGGPRKSRPTALKTAVSRARPAKPPTPPAP